MSLWRKILTAIGLSGAHGCCGEGPPIKGSGLKKIAIVGNPNVGKSLVFNRLTGAHATVSNYPGTTVGVLRGKARLDSQEFEVIDTPGMYSLLPITEEEGIARSLLMTEKPDVILQVSDAKNLERMLPLTLQLIEAGFPIVLELNMVDEMEAAVQWAAAASMPEPGDLWTGVYAEDGGREARG